MEYRNCVVSELRAEAEGRRLVGYAAVFDKRSLDLGGFVEVIKRGAFKQSLDDEEDIRALIDHDGIAIARTSNRTLTLKEDKVGLRTEIDLPDTTAGRDIQESVRRGDVDQMSFGFSVREGGQVFEEDDDGLLVRTLTEVHLREASIVTFPAYPDTTVATRSVQEWRDARASADAQAHHIRGRMRRKLELTIRGI